jgi:hypothetical protein
MTSSFTVTGGFSKHQQRTVPECCADASPPDALHLTSNPFAVAYWTIQDRRVANEEKLCALTSVRPREVSWVEEAEGQETSEETGEEQEEEEGKEEAEGEEEDAEVSGAGGRVDREDNEPVIMTSSSSSSETSSSSSISISSSRREWKEDIVLRESSTGDV